MKFHDALSNWAALRRGASKQRTQRYHQELIEMITRLWPEKCDASVTDISETDVAAFMPRIEHYSSSRFNGIVTMLKGVVPAAKPIRRRKVRLKERQVLSPDNLSRLVKNLNVTPRSHASLVIQFLAHTGLRINEARQVRWSDIGDDCVTLPASITKNGRPRVIPFVNGIRDVLDRLREVQKGEELVLPQAEAKRSLQTACRELGLPRLTHHDFRHMFATRCIESGVDVPTVARWLGHTDGGALLSRVYYHLVDEHSRRMAAKVVI